LAILSENYCKLETEYKNKISELEKCQCKNNFLSKELRNIKCGLDKCINDKNQLKKRIRKFILCIKKMSKR